MKYAMLIYTSEAEYAQLTPEEQETDMNGYWTFTNEVNEAGVNEGGEALHLTSMATSVRVRDGKTVITDGPFAETKEQLGGFYLLECKDLDEAIGYAAKIPGAKIGTIEIRPVMVFE
ncbi:MAG: YciI family protein [Chloroflexota bacterium]